LTKNEYLFEANHFTYYKDFSLKNNDKNKTLIAYGDNYVTVVRYI